MPRTPKQHEQVREDRRRALLQAAVELFALKGFAGAGTAEIAEAAGLSHGALFTYFPTKEALFREAVLAPLPATLALICRLCGAPGEPRARIEELARTMLASFAREESYLALVQYVVRQRERFPDLAGEIEGFVEAAVDKLAAVIAEGQAAGSFLPGVPGRLAFFFYALIQGCGLFRPSPPGDVFWDEAVQAAMRLLVPPPPSTGPAKEANRS